MAQPPLHHIVRVRSSDDFTYASPGLMDEILVNANQLENSIQTTVECLRGTTLPYSIDPVLWRFQLPKWWSNAKGVTKKNYRRLGDDYVRGTGIRIADGPLLETVPSELEWLALASNVMRYQLTRLQSIPAQTDLFGSDVRELRPARLMAPALVAYSPVEDRINRLLVEGSLAEADAAVAAQVIVPADRLTDKDQLKNLLTSIPSQGVNAYFLWTPGITEERLLSDTDALGSLLFAIDQLSARGVPVGHQYANYTIAALHEVGIAAVAHHLGWVDKGELGEDKPFMIRSCNTYVPGVRHSIRFREASDAGRSLTEEEYVDAYCECGFCSGVLNSGGHPMDLLLESETRHLSNGQERQTPTSRAVGANTWHFLLSRRLEVQAFSERSAVNVIERDIERAAKLNRASDAAQLRHLATNLRSA